MVYEVLLTQYITIYKRQTLHICTSGTSLSRIFFISDPSLRELTQQILPLASHYSMVMRFIQEKSYFEYGQVNHALTAAMSSLIKDYMVLVAQLETANRKSNFSLHKLWFFIQPTLHTMEILANIASTISKVSLQKLHHSEFYFWHELSYNTEH
jgi:gamma-tubulin complex component 2